MTLEYALKLLESIASRGMISIFCQSAQQPAHPTNSHADTVRQSESNLIYCLLTRLTNGIQDTSNRDNIGTHFHSIMLGDHTQIKPAQGQAWPHEYDGLTAALPLSPQNHEMSAMACPDNQLRFGQTLNLHIPVPSPFQPFKKS